MDSEHFKKLQQEYIKTIPHKLQLLENSIKNLHLSCTQKDLLHLQELLDLLASYAQTFGFAEASLLCKTWETKIKKQLEKFSSCQPHLLIVELSAFLQELEKLFQKQEEP